MFYALVGLRGPLALVLKYALLGAADALLILLLSAAINKSSFIIAGVVIATLIFLNYSFITKGAIPLKFLSVGLIFFTIFVVTPTGYTILMSTYNFKTGNEIARESAIVEILNNGLLPDDAGTTYDLFLGKSPDDQFAAILFDPVRSQLLYATERGTRPISEGDITRDSTGFIIEAKGIVKLTDEEFSGLDAVITNLRFPLGDGSFANPQGTDVAARLTQSIEYNKNKDQLINVQSG